MSTKRILMLIGDYLENPRGYRTGSGCAPSWLRAFLAVLGTRIEP